MAPLNCACVSDMYGQDFGKSQEELLKIKLKLKENEMLQNQLQKNEVCAENNQNYQNNLKKTDIISNRPSYKTYPDNNINNNPFQSDVRSNTHYNNVDNPNFNPPIGRATYNELINKFTGMGKEYYGDPTQHIINLLQEIIFLLKVFLMIIVLFLIIKIFEKK